MADELTPQEQEEFEFRHRMEQDQPQPMAQPSNIPGTNVDYSAPGFVAGTVGVVGGALAGPGLKSEFDKYGVPGLKPQVPAAPLVPPTFKSPTEVAEQAIKNRIPSVTVEGVPESAVKNYGTSQFVSPEGKGLYYGSGQTGDYSGARKSAKEAIAAEKQFPGMKSIEGGRTPFSVPEHIAKELEALRVQEEAARNAHNQAEVSRVAHLRASRLQALENAYKELNAKPGFMEGLRGAPVQAARRGIENVGDFLNRTISPHGMATAGSRALGALGGLDVGLQGTNAVEHAMKGEFGRAVVSGLGALGGAAALTRHPLLMPIGMGAAMAAPYINDYLDTVAEKHPGMHMADGGSVPPEMGTAQAYEPSYNERIRDAIAPYIGMQQARGLMGSQGADSESKYNPLSMLAQVPGSLGQNAKDFVHSSSEGDYLGAMGSYLSGAMDAAPLLGGPGKLARLLNYQAGNKAFDKGIDAAEPYIEKGVKAVAPTIAKGIRFIDDVLPKHKSVLAGTHLSPNLYNGQHVQIEGHAVGGKIIGGAASLAKKFGVDPYKISQAYPDVIAPMLAVDAKTGKEFLQKQLSPEALGVQKARKAAQKEIDAGNYQPHFDIEQRYYADPSHYPTAGYTATDIVPKKADTIAKYEALANDPEALARLRGAYEKAKDRPAAKDWYAMGQLEDAFIKELGPEEGRKQFKNRFADAMAATTGGADPNSNLMMAAYTNFQKNLGHEIPTKAADLPFPIGGRFVSGNMEQAKKLADAGEIPVTNPKRHNFSANFLGHRDVSTLDEQMSQLWDPKMMSPPPNAYGIYQQALAKEAEKAGVQPANFQDIAWAGAKDYPGKPMMQEINEMLARTSKITGEPQEEVLKGFIRADKPMYGIGALGAGEAMNQDDAQPKKKGGKVKKAKKK